MGSQGPFVKAIERTGTTNGLVPAETALLFDPNSFALTDQPSAIVTDANGGQSTGYTLVKLSGVSIGGAGAAPSTQIALDGKGGGVSVDFMGLFNWTGGGPGTEASSLLSTDGTKMQIGDGTMQWLMSGPGSGFISLGFTDSNAVSIGAGIATTYRWVMTSSAITAKVNTAVKMTINATGLGLYTATPVAQASRVGALTDSTTGTPSTTIGDVGSSFSQSGLNNIHASLLAKINALELALHNIGLTA